MLLYKSGSEASLVAGVTRGLEPYSEFYASQIATCLGFSHVDYNLAMYKGRLCSTCPLFTSEKIGYLPAERLDLIQGFLQKRVEDILRYGENADKYLRIAENPVGVNSKDEKADVGVNVDLDALSLQVLWNMKADPFVTAKILADVLGVEQRTIERRIRALREKNVLKRIGEDKSGHWQVLV